MSSAKTSKAGWKVKLALAGLLVVGLVVAIRFLPVQETLRQVLYWVQEQGAWGPLIFILIYILATILFIPGWMLTLGAGVLFGILKGSAYVITGATLGATAAFLLGRYLARDWVAKKIAHNKKFAAIDEAVGRDGWKIVGLTRLSPIFPFNLLNYAFGLTNVSFLHYFFASLVGMIPGTVMYVYIGSLVGDLATLGTGQRERTTGEWVLYGVGLAAAVVVTIFITRRAQRALRQKMT